MGKTKKTSVARTKINCRNRLAGGLFTGKYNASQTDAPATMTHVDKVYRERFLRDASLEALSVIEPVASAHGLSLIDVAMRWLVHHSALCMRSEGGNEYVYIRLLGPSREHEQLTLW
jgi:aflatoxin B1 aldehyde reductase